MFSITSRTKTRRILRSRSCEDHRPCRWRGGILRLSHRHFCICFVIYPFCSKKEGGKLRQHGESVPFTDSCLPSAPWWKGNTQGSLTAGGEGAVQEMASPRAFLPARMLAARELAPAMAKVIFLIKTPRWPKPRNLPSLSLGSSSVQMRAWVSAVFLVKLPMAVHTAASEEQGTRPVGNPEDSSCLTQACWLMPGILHWSTTAAT